MKSIRGQKFLDKKRPTATLLLPVVVGHASLPTAVLWLPVVSTHGALPTAVLCAPVVSAPASLPIAMLCAPVVMDFGFEQENFGRTTDQL